MIGAPKRRRASQFHRCPNGDSGRSLSASNGKHLRSSPALILNGDVHPSTKEHCHTFHVPANVHQCPTVDSTSPRWHLNWQRCCRVATFMQQAHARCTSGRSKRSARSRSARQAGQAGQASGGRKSPLLASVVQGRASVTCNCRQVGALIDDCLPIQQAGCREHTSRVAAASRRVAVTLVFRSPTGSRRLKEASGRNIRLISSILPAPHEPPKWASMAYL